MPVLILYVVKKYTYDIRLNLHIFVPGVSEAPGVVFKKMVRALKGYQNSSKNHKSPENISYFKTRVNTMSTYTPQISPTDARLL